MPPKITNIAIFLQEGHFKLKFEDHGHVAGNFSVPGCREVFKYQHAKFDAYLTILVGLKIITYGIR